MGGDASVDDDSAGSLVINGSAICQADSRGMGGNKYQRDCSSKGKKESEKKGTKREDKAEMESGKEPKGSR